MEPESEAYTGGGGEFGRQKISLVGMGTKFFMGMGEGQLLAYPQTSIDH